MTIIAFILGILLILCIARYNESNKLFWTLLTAYTLSFTAAKMYYDIFGEKEQSEKTLKQASPTQGLAVTSDTCMCFVTDELPTTNVKVTSKPASQVSMPVYIECIPTLSDVSVVTPGQYLHNLANPPNDLGCYDTS